MRLSLCVFSSFELANKTTFKSQLFKFEHVFFAMFTITITLEKKCCKHGLPKPILNSNYHCFTELSLIY